MYSHIVRLRIRTIEINLNFFSFFKRVVGDVVCSMNSKHQELCERREREQKACDKYYSAAFGKEKNLSKAFSLVNSFWALALLRAQKDWESYLSFV